MAYTVPWNLIGFSVSGDVGGLTIYTDRHGRKVAFPKSPPKTAATPGQIAQRARFKAAHTAWAALSELAKRRLELAVKRASIVMTGQNLFISVSLTNDQAGYATLSRQTGLILPMITFIP